MKKTIVEIDESKFTRHENVGRMLVIYEWVVGLCVRKSGWDRL